MYIESLTVYPIKSCGGWPVPANTRWEVKDEGLAWDREWCLVHAGTYRALSQKRYPRMTLLRPKIDLEAGLLRVTLHDNTEKSPWQISIPLFSGSDQVKARSSNVCSESVDAHVYTSPHITRFLQHCSGGSLLSRPLPTRWLRAEQEARKGTSPATSTLPKWVHRRRQHFQLSTLPTAATNPPLK